MTDTITSQNTEFSSWINLYIVAVSFLPHNTAILLEFIWNLMAHGDAREGKWRGKWRMEWVASTLTLPRNMVYPTLLTLMRTPRLPAVDWTDAPADLNGLVRFGEKRNLVSGRVPSRFKRTLQQWSSALASQVSQADRANPSALSHHATNLCMWTN